MEQNRTLMIIVSVAVFLAAIVGVGVALLYPRGDGSGAVAEGGSVEEFDPIEYVRRPEASPLSEPEEEPVIIVYGVDEGPESETVEEPASEEPASPVTVAPVPTVTVTPTPEPRTFGPSGPQPVAAAPVERAPEPRTERVTEYWIQLVASPSRDRVEQALLSIEELGVGGRITTRDVEGTIYYRLRVGPYQSKDEAEKFLGWIREIERFAEAYISEEYPVRSLGG